MHELLDSGDTRVVAYLLAGGVAVIVGWRETRRSERATLWPPFWFLTALLLVVLGIARAGGLGDLLVDLGREQAEQGGWYATRRTIQGLAVIIVSAVWSGAVIVWRVSPGRRRYLPAAIAAFSLVCFIAIRVVSLHQVDTVLYRRDLSGVRFVAIIELGLLAVMVATTGWPMLLDRRRAQTERAQRRAPDHST